MTDQERAKTIVERLQNGIPPNDGVKEYSVGNEKFLDQIRKYHLPNEGNVDGKIRFVSGSWGCGKSHFLTQVRDIAFDANYLVSYVNLSADEAPFHRFEEVFYRIVKQISSPEMHKTKAITLDSPLNEVFRHYLFRSGSGSSNQSIDREIYVQAREKLMKNSSIDIDFRRLVCHFWETYLPDLPDVIEPKDSAMLEESRGRIMQWFSGEGTIGPYRKEFGVQKLIKRSNARTILNSLAHYATFAGYNGIVILFDEAEMSYSILKKANLTIAHNNLLHLINNVENTRGLFLIYATTPDFYVDENYGVVNYGALAQRIGKPNDDPPQALDKIWNLDQAKPNSSDYQKAARKIRDLYITAFPENERNVSKHDDLDSFVTRLVKNHPRYEAEGFWRVLVKRLIEHFHKKAEGIKST